LYSIVKPFIRTLSYAPGPLNNEMQAKVRETLGDPEQLELYTKMADEVIFKKRQ
jgi:sepiapterin reductase